MPSQNDVRKSVVQVLCGGVLLLVFAWWMTTGRMKAPEPVEVRDGNAESNVKERQPVAVSDGGNGK